MMDVKVALITAGGSGMGADSARALAADGFKVGILSSSGKGEALAKELGVDILDCSGGGAVPEARGAIGNRTAEQPDMAGVIRKATGLPVMAVGASPILRMRMTWSDHQMPTSFYWAAR